MTWSTDFGFKHTVTLTSVFAGVFDVTFTGTHAQSNVPQMGGDISDAFNPGGGAPYLKYTYDIASQLLTAEGMGPKLTLTYTSEGRVGTATRDAYLDAPKTKLDYAYDSNGNRKKTNANIWDTSAGAYKSDFQNDYTYNGWNQVTTLTQQNGPGTILYATDPKRVDFTYDAAGRMLSLARYKTLTANSASEVATTLYSYDNANRVTAIAHQKANANLVTPHQYTYDPMSRVKTYTNEDGVATYTYDQTSQLKAVDNSILPDTSYGYDLAGNRNTAGYQTTPANRMTNDGTYSYTYDNEGNRTRRSRTSDNTYTDYEYDHRNRLTKVTDKTSGGVATKIVEYVYDAFDRRTVRKVDATADGVFETIDHFIFDGDDVALEFGIEAGQTELRHRYLHGPAVDQILADERLYFDVAPPEHRLVWPLTDAQGTVRDLVNNNGGNHTHYVYDAFGNRSGSGSLDTMFGYTGREWDSATKLNYHRARWYDPAIGKWINEDPIGFGGGDYNLSRYVGNGATNWVDPSGLEWEWQWEWHHLLPVEVFGDKDIPGVDINSAEYGFMLRGIDHRGADIGVHAEGWNDIWKDWYDKQTADGVEITKELIEKQLKKMMGDFKLETKGFAAKYGYEMRQLAYAIAQEMWRTGRPIGSKALSKGFEAAKEAAETVDVKVPKIRARVKGAGLLGAVIGFFASAAFGSDDPVGDAIDDTLFTTRMGNSERGNEPYRDWNNYQWQLDRLQAERDAAQAKRDEFEKYIGGLPPPPDDFWGPFEDPVGTPLPGGQFPDLECEG